jgi:hypothetical protein
VATIFVVPEYVDVNAFDRGFWTNVFYTVLISWGPIIIIEKIVACLRPTEMDRVCETVEEGKRRTSFYGSESKDVTDIEFPNFL